MASELMTFHTLAEAGPDIFEASSPTYWRIGAEYYAKSQADILPEGFDLDTVFVDGPYYDRLLGRTDLVDWINSPFS